MAQTVRAGLSASQKRELWRRWKAGQSLSDIGREFGKPAATIFGIVVLEGGISPPVRTRSPLALRLVEPERVNDFETPLYRV